MRLLILKFCKKIVISFLNMFEHCNRSKTANKLFDEIVHVLRHCECYQSQFLLNERHFLAMENLLCTVNKFYAYIT